MNILREIAIRTRERIEAKKKLYPPETLAEAALARHGSAYTFPFEAALRGDDIALICEIKRASPSKGRIADDFPYLDIARDYEKAGAAAISVLTEPFYFHGEDRYLREIADTVYLPLLRKDFVIDPYMLYEAKLLGAGAVLLICSLLGGASTGGDATGEGIVGGNPLGGSSLGDNPLGGSPLGGATGGDILAEYIAAAHQLGLSALVEAHDGDEVQRALAAGARIIGVNNRDLKTFAVDITLSERLRKLVPPDILFVSESGIQSPEDIARLRDIGANAALVGERIMRSADKPSEIARLRGDRI